MSRKELLIKHKKLHQQRFLPFPYRDFPSPWHSWKIKRLILGREIFRSPDPEGMTLLKKPCGNLASIYHMSKVAGGDMQLELKKTSIRRFSNIPGIFINHSARGPDAISWRNYFASCNTITKMLS